MLFIYNLKNLDKNGGSNDMAIFTLNTGLFTRLLLHIVILNMEAAGSTNTYPG